MSASETKKTDKQGYNDHYRGRNFELAPTKEAYVRKFEKSLQPLYLGGWTKGYVRKVATDLLFQEIRTSLKQGNQVTVLDAGCGLGQLAIYLACNGCNVVGIDISEEGCAVARSAAEDLNLTDNCTFHAVSLEDIPLPDSSVDYIIGHASLHHFIKYEAVPSEFFRILKPNGQGVFADAFGENPVYKIFHNRKKME
jgi:ubiquinone/menaquinone biosynthesis C-methylase UbiE